MGYVLGAPIAGALIATVGSSNAPWIDAGSFVLAALVVALAVPAAGLAIRSRTPYVRELLQGLSLSAREPVVRALRGLLGVALFGAFGTRVPRRSVYVGLAVAYPDREPRAASATAARTCGRGPRRDRRGRRSGVPLFHTVRQERTPPELRARVFSIVAAAEAIAVPLGVLVAAHVVELLGLRAAFVTFAAGNALYAVLKLALPATRDLARPRRAACAPAV